MKWLCIILLFTFNGGHHFKVTYKIDAKSRLYLSGKTNINKYECYCTDDFPKGIISGVQHENGNAEFRNAVLQVKTSLLSCKNKLMNRDMHKALKAEEHPYIIITLHHTEQLSKTGKLNFNTWYPFTAHVTLCIAGVSQKTQLQVYVNKLSNHLFQLKASKDLLMSDFHVKPRTPFNMIKIEDTVTINFNMTVMVYDAINE